MTLNTRLILYLALLTLAVACTKSQKPAEQTLNPLDRANSTRIKPQNFLHKTFPVKKYAQFEFEVPPHSAIPRLTGTFKSFVPRKGDENRSDDSTNVAFLLMNADQFSDFAHGDSSGTALYATELTHNHEVDFLLPPTQQDSAKYYVVFRNSGALKYVEADFTLTFGY
jgi:hypothetical protein